MKRRMFILTLEQIDQRYTKQWYLYFKKEFSKYFDVEYIDGGSNKEQKIEKGRFLDINKTNEWKARQVIAISKMFQEDKIKEGDIFFFCDGWNFAITALRYMSQLNKIPVHIYTYLHAGTWDPYDFITQVGMREWAPANEAGWLLACDGHFVATEFHKNMIVNYFGFPEFDQIIHVVGFPMDWEKELKPYIGYEKKENLVLFPHRLDTEKRPDVFDMLAEELPEYKFVKTLNVTKNKKEYYRLMRKAKVVFSASEQETFGIGTVEGLILGAVPVVPNGLAYRELYSHSFLYQNISDAKHKIRYAMKHYDGKRQKQLKKNSEKLIEQCKNSIPKMAGVINDGIRNSK